MIINDIENRQVLEQKLAALREGESRVSEMGDVYLFPLPDLTPVKVWKIYGRASDGEVMGMQIRELENGSLAVYSPYWFPSEEELPSGDRIHLVAKNGRREPLLYYRRKR